MKIQKQKNKGFRGYIFSREINGNFIPQRVQNLVIKDFAFRKNIFFKLSSTEYKMKNSYYMLKALLKDISNLDGIIFYSFEMLLDVKKLRLDIFNKFIKNKKKIFFALEELKISNLSDIDKIEKLFAIKKKMTIKKIL